MFNSKRKEKNMKFMILIAAILSIGISTVYADTKKYTKEQIKEMPMFSSIERKQCPKSRYASIRKRLQCKEKVRIRLYEKQVARQNLD